MTTVEFLHAYGDKTEGWTKDLLLPVKVQEEDETDPKPRAATVYLMRLPETKKAEKKAPYILHAVAEGEDKYTDHHDGYGGKATGRHQVDTVEVRSVFCVYAEDRQQGGLYLLELIDRVKEGLKREPTIGPFLLDLEKGIDWTVYDSDEWDLGNYHVGGMVTTWTKKAQPRPEVSVILRGEGRPGGLPIPGLYNETKTFLKGETEHGE